MNRHVIVGILGLALVGCAQGRTSVSRSSQGVGGPVGLPPEAPPLYETINGGRPQSGPIASDAGRTQSGPAPSGLATNSGNTGPAGRPAPYAGQTVGEARPQAPAPAEVAAAPDPRATAPTSPEPPGPSAAPTSAPAGAGRVALDTSAAPSTARAGTPVSDVVSGMTQPPSTAPNPTPSAAPDPLLGSNPPIMPAMEPPGTPATADRPTAAATGPGSAPASDPGPNPTTEAPASASSNVPRPAPARDPLLGANPDVMPVIEMPPDPAVKPPALAPSRAPAGLPPVELPAPSTPTGPGAAPAADTRPGALPEPGAPPASAPASTPGPTSGALPPAEAPAVPPPSPASSPAKPRGRSAQPAPDPSPGRDPGVMPPIEADAPAPANPPAPGPEALPPPVAVPPPDSSPAVPDRVPPQLPPADPPQVEAPGAAADPRPGVDPAVRLAAADPSTVRSEVPARRLLEAGKVAARVGDDVITLHELTAAVKERLKNKPPEQSLSRQEINMLAAAVLNDLIERDLILQEARRKLKDPKKMQMITDVSDRVWREHELPPLLRRYAAANEQELKQKLAEHGQTVDELREAFRHKFLSQSYIEQELGARMKVDVPEMRDYYNAHLKEFDRPAQVTWREVLIEVNKYPSRAEARRKVDALLARLLRGDDFARVAQAESDGPNKSKGGLWETTPGSYAVAEVNSALERLPLRQVSQVIESAGSYHIVRVEDRRAAGPARFDEVQDQIRDTLSRAKVEREMNAYLEKLRSRTIITTMFDGTDSDPALMRRK